MIAEPAVQLRLLDLQALDARLDLIAHKRRSLPQLATIAELEGRVAALRDRIVAGETEVDDLERGQAKAESDVELVRSRAAKDQELLASGRVGSAKDLENLQHEVASLARRQGDLEEVELEITTSRFLSSSPFARIVSGAAGTSGMARGLAFAPAAPTCVMTAPSSP